MVRVFLERFLELGFRLSKPANTRARPMTNSANRFGMLFGVIWMRLRGTPIAMWRSWSLSVLRYCDLIGRYWITSNQLNFWETGGSANQISAEISGFSFNIPVIISLRLTDKGATTPKLVSG